MATDPVYIKDPNAVLDYLWDWSDWLSSGETITASTMTSSSGITVDSSTFDDTTSTAWVSGGTTGQAFKVTNRITTSGGRTDERSITLRVTNR